MSESKFQALVNAADSYPDYLCATLNGIHAAGACRDGYAKLLRAIRDNYAMDTQQWGDRLIPIAAILESNGPDDAFWVLRNAVPRYEGYDRFMRHLACDFAAEVLPIWEKHYPDDKRVAQCIEASRRCIDGEISLDELQAARDGARQARAAAAAAAAYAAYAAAAAAAAYAAYAAAAAAYADADAAAAYADAAADADAYAAYAAAYADADAYAAYAAAYAYAADARLALKNKVLGSALEAGRASGAAKADEAAPEVCIASSDVPY